MTSTLLLGDCLEVLKNTQDNSIDAVVTDPPYGLSFMGKKWDYDVPRQEIWEECLRVLKPGGYLLAFAGTRTQHRMAIRIEDAGFEIRDMIAWVYGSGFPKSLNIGKAVDKLQDRGFEEVCELGRHIKECRESKGISRKEVNEMFGAVAICNHWEAQDRNNALPPTVEHWNILKTYLGCSDKFDFIVERVGKERDVVGLQEKAMSGWNMDGSTQFKDRYITKGTSEWEGWGTALKPALEPITVARKPLGEKTVAENCLKWGTGGINIDESRVGTGDRRMCGTTKKSGETSYVLGAREETKTEIGRFPANFIHDGSDEVVGLFPNTGKGNGGKPYNYSGKEYDNKDTSMFNGDKPQAPSNFNDSGSASRFFYCAKASKSERNRGCEDMPDKAPAYESHRANYATTHGIETPFAGTGRSGKNFKNNHPTVKPIALMEYLVKLVSKEGATVLDPFMGSGSTGIACKNLGRNFIGVERDEEYIKIAEARIKS